jgi:hypothetical protein
MQKHRTYSDLAVENFKLALNTVDWTDICANSALSTSPTEVYKLFHNKFFALFNTFFPLRSSRSSKSNTPRKDWITKGLIKSCKKKSLLYKSYLKNCTPDTKSRYVKYRNKLKTPWQKAERHYIRQQFHLFAGNLRQT